LQAAEVAVENESVAIARLKADLKEVITPLVARWIRGIRLTRALEPVPK